MAGSRAIFDPLTCQNASVDKHILARCSISFNASAKYAIIKPRLSLSAGKNGLLQKRQQRIKNALTQLKLA